MSKDDFTIRNIARKYAEWIQRPKENPLPQVVQPAARRAEEMLKYRPIDEAHQQDQQLQVLKEQQEAARRQIAEQEAMLHPRDGGEIDDPAMPQPGPGTRDPHTFQREFSNDAEKDAYLERVRQAQAAVKK